MAFTSPLDQLFMDEDEQSVLGYVARAPRSTQERLARGTGICPGRLEPLLDRLVRQAHLVEELVDGQRVFSLRYQPTSPRNRSHAGGLDLFYE